MSFNCSTKPVMLSAAEPKHLYRFVVASRISTEVEMLRLRYAALSMTVMSLQ
jgi:hypothetical protein